MNLLLFGTQVVLLCDQCVTNVFITVLRANLKEGNIQYPASLRVTECLPVNGVENEPKDATPTPGEKTFVLRLIRRG